MLCTTFLRAVGASRNRSTVFTRHVAPQVTSTPGNCRSCSAKVKRDDDSELDDLDKPIKYSTSEASQWQAKNFRDSETLPYQTYVVTGSLAVFMIYFFYLREENDIDFKLYQSLKDHLPDAPMYTTEVQKDK